MLFWLLLISVRTWARKAKVKWWNFIGSVEAPREIKLCIHHAANSQTNAGHSKALLEKYAKPQ